MPIKVLIIDDSALVRETLTTVLSTDPAIKVIGTASDPIFGVRKISQERPDVIILDIEMARMDGLTFLRKINETVDPIPCIICSSQVESGSPNAIRALEYGACELIQKPLVGTRKFLEESKIRICDAVHSAFQSRGKLKQIIPSQLSGGAARQTPIKAGGIQPKLTADVILEKPVAGTIPTDATERVVVIGASTGGTEALKDVLSAMPAEAPGIVVVQHMPEHFTNAFANRLNGLSQMTIKEAEDGDRVERGIVLIAPGNKHTLLKRIGKEYYVEVKDGPLVARHRPSVDVLFRSAARYAGRNAVGVIMTGMGDDGARGMREMHDAGAYTIAQDEASCIVFGMPAEAIKNGAVDKIVPLQSIAKSILSATIIH